MTIFMLFLLSNSFLGREYKHVCHPEVVRAESTHSYDVLHYLIDLYIPMTSRYLEGAVTISARSNENGLTTVDLHLLGLNVDSVKVNGVTATYNHVYETLHVNLPQPFNINDSFDIKVGYSGTTSGTMGFIWVQSWYPVAYTLGCPYSTRMWMPCYDRMWDKADHGVEFYIRVPDQYTVCANGEFLGTQVAGGYATFHWKHAYPISPYLIHFAASDYVVLSEWYHASPADSVELLYFVWPSDTGFTANAFGLMTDMMYFYDSLYGPYPFERYGMDVIPGFYYGGMEHQTLATIHRDWLTNWIPDVFGMAHELSHMWWGDMVTCFGWENVWLNEGFATYSDALYLGRIQGHQAYIDTMKLRRNVYFGAEAANPHSMYDPPPNLLFSWSHSYCKASWVLHMIRYLCGDDATWLNLMAAYRNSFAYGSASTEDLNTLMNTILAGDYDWFFDEWVYGLGYPRYDIAWSAVYEAPNWRLVLDITQIQTIGPAVFHMPLPIGVNCAGGDTLITLAINASPQQFEFVLPIEPTGITVDPETWVIQQNTVTGVGEYVAKGDLFVQNIQTIGRAIDVKLSMPGLVRIYDITGRQVYETTTAELHYRPSSAGIYHVIVAGEKHRVVVVK
ncbi:M1 family metallopeptidase [candidate division WOR-3 bacterium]|nr:M1 family metallopeptidase [candidate division WOR-3 bacterium]